MNFEIPSYVVSTVEDLKSGEGVELRQTSEKIEFPLNIEDKIDVAKLMGKFKNQTFYMGMSAPQLGILKRAIVFTKPREETSDRCRTKVWLNPSYEKVGDKTVEDYECCASVRGVIGPVERYDTISYKAFDIKGNEVTGEARGKTARIIQHEIDHLEGKLFVDLVPDGKLMTIREFYANSAKNRESEKHDTEEESDNADADLNHNLTGSNNDMELKKGNST